MHLSSAGDESIDLIIIVNIGEQSENEMRSA